jgi:hypothetical protein
MIKAAMSLSLTIMVEAGYFLFDVVTSFPVSFFELAAEAAVGLLVCVRVSASGGMVTSSQ